MTASAKFEIATLKWIIDVRFVASTQWWWEITSYNRGFQLQLGFVGLEVWYYG